MADKTLDGWDKSCENCGSDFTVKLREKELGFFGSLKAIGKMSKSIFKPDNTKTGTIQKKQINISAVFALEKATPLIGIVQDAK